VVRVLNYSCDESTGWQLGLLGGVDSESEGPEAVVVDALGWLKRSFPVELEALDVELVVQGFVEG